MCGTGLCVWDGKGFGGTNVLLLLYGPSGRKEGLRRGAGVGWLLGERWGLGDGAFLCGGIEVVVGMRVGVVQP